jgi:hypothetical protein
VDKLLGKNIAAINAIVQPVYRAGSNGVFHSDRPADSIAPTVTGECRGVITYAAVRRRAFSEIKW